VYKARIRLRVCGLWQDKLRQFKGEVANHLARARSLSKVSAEGGHGWKGSLLSDWVVEPAQITGSTPDRLACRQSLMMKKKYSPDQRTVVPLRQALADLLDDEESVYLMQLTGMAQDPDGADRDGGYQDEVSAPDALYRS
jgi:hypothetical protein